MTEPPRCLIVTSNFPPIRGGSTVVYENLCKFGKGAVLALAPYMDSDSMECLHDWQAHDQEAPYVVYRIRTLKSRSIPAKSLLHTLWLSLRFELPLKLRVLRQVITIVRRHNVRTICIGELVTGGWLVVVGKYFLGRKVIIYVHGEEITIRNMEWSLPKLRPFYLRNCDAIVAVSTFAQRALVEQMGIDRTKITLIANGVDLDKFYPQPKAATLMARYGLVGQRVLVSVGRLVPRKGVDRTLVALRIVLQRHSNIHYLVVGGGSYRAELERIARQVEVSQHVTFVGEVPEDEITMHYALGDIFILPNRETADGDNEGFGLVFLEANACGIPVIAGRAGGVQDVVLNGDNGLTVDGNNPEAIAEAILRLLEDPELCARLRRAGIKRACASDWRSPAEQFQALCQELARGGRASDVC